MLICRLRFFVVNSPTVSVTFADYDIAQLGKEWGYCRTDARTSQFVRTWFERIANGILRLAKIYGVDMSRFRR